MAEFRITDEYMTGDFDKRIEILFEYAKGNKKSITTKNILVKLLETEPKDSESKEELFLRFRPYIDESDFYKLITAELIDKENNYVKKLELLIKYKSILRNGYISLALASAISRCGDYQIANSIFQMFLPYIRERSSDLATVMRSVMDTIDNEQERENFFLIYSDRLEGQYLKDTLMSVHSDIHKRINLVRKCKGRLPQDSLSSIIEELLRSNLSFDEKKSLLHEFADGISYENVRECVESLIKKTPDLAERKKIAIEFIEDANIQEMVECLASCKYDDSEVELLGLPKDMTIGIELEFERATASALMVCRELELFAPGDRFSKWTIKKDQTVSGGEVTSPPISDDENAWKELREICTLLQAAGAKITPACGGHIHIGSTFLGIDEKAWENLLSIWGEGEEIFYKMCNAEGEVIRPGVNLYANSKAGKIQNMLEKGSICIETQQDLESWTRMYSESSRYGSLNLINIGNRTKDTVEFRIPNGTIDFKTVRENILLFGNVMRVAREMSKNPEYKRKEYEEFLERDVEEGDKVKKLLNLLFETDKERNIYQKRWERVKDEEIYDTISSGKPTYNKDRKFEITDMRQVDTIVSTPTRTEVLRTLAEEREREEREQMRRDLRSLGFERED